MAYTPSHPVRHLPAQWRLRDTQHLLLIKQVTGECPAFGKKSLPALLLAYSVLLQAWSITAYPT